MSGLLRRQMSVGWNPQHGHDNGPRGSMPFYPGNPFMPPPGPGFGYGVPYGYGYPVMPMPVPVGDHTMPQFPIQPNGAGNPFARMPGPAPAVDPDMPSAHLTNSTGGTGCEPGFNYFFAADHAKVYVLRCDSPPWQAPDTTQIGFTASHVPTNVTVGELMRGFGCDNPVAKKNKVVEVVPGGQGNWYKGMVISGDDKDLIKMPLQEIGWDSQRGDESQGRPGIFLWFCRGS